MAADVSRDPIILRASTYRRMAWKNGGGETYEISISPPDSSLDTFDSRVSMATVAQDGPFSEFPGIDRTLCVLDGAGLELESSDGTHVLTPASAPLCFPADRRTHARLSSGTITDLNVMTRRNRYRSTIRRVAVDTEQTVALVGEQSLLFCERGEISCTFDGRATIQLGPRDSALPCTTKTVAIAAHIAASLYVISFRRAIPC